jgi:hypothetical protein
MPKIILYKTGERPDLQLWLLDDDGTLIDFSSGYTFAFKIGRPGSAAEYTKTSNITGAAGAGTEPDGTPNITMTFTAAELDDVTANPNYIGQLRATTSSLDRLFQFPVEVKDVIT